MLNQARAAAAAKKTRQESSGAVGAEVGDPKQIVIAGRTRATGRHASAAEELRFRRDQKKMVETVKPLRNEVDRFIDESDGTAWVVREFEIIGQDKKAMVVEKYTRLDCVV